MKSPGGAAKLGFWVKSMAGESRIGAAGSVEMGTSGLALTIADTSAIRVESTSCVRRVCLSCKSMESKILRVTPIIRSHTPPMWDACGGLNFHVQPLLWRYLKMLVRSSSGRAMPSSVLAATKLVPLSDQSCFAGPLTAKNLRNALMQLLVSIAQCVLPWCSCM